MIDYEGPSGVAERWQPELDAIAPRTERGTSWFHLMWEPGEVWAPVMRWVIWEVSPFERAPGFIQDDLRGPNPRLFGKWDAAAGKFRQERSFTVNMRQWDFYQQTGCYGRPVFVVQGERGGHRRRWSDVQQNVIMAQTGMDTMPDGGLEPPAPGDLCYAEPDSRTIRKLAADDLVRLYGDILHRVALRGGTSLLDIREQRVARQMAEIVFRHVEEEVEDALDAMVTKAVADELWDHATDEEYRHIDPDEAAESHIEQIAHSTAR